MEYLVIKFLHVISNYLWVGGLIGTTYCSRFSLDVKWIRKIYFSIQNPGLIGSLILGILLLFISPNVNFKEPWLHLKLTAVSLLAVFDLTFLRNRLLKGVKIPLWATFVWGGLIVSILGSIYIWKPLIRG